MNSVILKTKSKFKLFPTNPKLIGSLWYDLEKGLFNFSLLSLFSPFWSFRVKDEEGRQVGKGQCL